MLQTKMSFTFPPKLYAHFSLANQNIKERNGGGVLWLRVKFLSESDQVVVGEGT